MIEVHDDDGGGGDDGADLEGNGDGKPSVTFRGWFSAPTFGTLLPETETVKFINNFPLLITFLAENISELVCPHCHNNENFTRKLMRF